MSPSVVAKCVVGRQCVSTEPLGGCLSIQVSDEPFLISKKVGCIENMVVVVDSCENSLAIPWKNLIVEIDIPTKCTSNVGFLKWGYLSIHFNRVFHCKPSIWMHLGVPEL